MENVGPLLLVCGMFCVGPIALTAFGYWLGSRGIRFRSPLVRGPRLTRRGDSEIRYGAGK